MQLAMLISLLFFAATFANKDVAVNSPLSILGPKRVEPPEEAASNSASPQEAPLKGASPKRYSPMEVPGIENMISISPPRKGSSRLEKMFNLNSPLKKLPEFKSEHASRCEDGSSESACSMSEGSNKFTLSESDEVWAPSPWETKSISRVPTITWDDAVEKGKEVWEELQVAIRSNTPDRPTSISKLEGQGWIFDMTGDECELDNLQKIKSQLRIPPGYNKHYMRVALHEVPPVPPGKGRRTTVFKNAFSREQGILIAMSNFKQESETTPWSEVAFAKWYESTYHRGDPTNLNYIVRHSIENINTVFIIKEAHKKAGVPLHENVKLWKEGFDEAFYALMGTPNGKGVPRMLKDHNQKLGRKTIEAIYTARSADKKIHMIFGLRTANAPTRISKQIFNAAAQMGMASRASSSFAAPVVKHAVPSIRKARKGHFTLHSRATTSPRA